MINPIRITDYQRTDRELEAFWIFCICVAGKNADQTAAKVSALVSMIPPDRSIRKAIVEDPKLLDSVRMGQYNRILRAIHASEILDLRTATLEDLEGVYGVGPKTARFFLLHSRPDQRVAVLDVHILRWMAILSKGKGPRHTPNGNKYRALEQKFFALADEMFPGVPYAEVDLAIWTQFSGRLK